MRTGTMAFLAGVVWLQQWGQLPDSAWSWGLLVSVPVSLILRCLPTVHGTRRGIFYLIFVTAALSSGFFWALLMVQPQLAQRLAPELEGRDMLLQGQVASLVQPRQRSRRFEFDVQRAWLAGHPVAISGRVRLSWYGKSVPVLQPGQHWHLRVRLKQPHGFQNPGGFDYEGWLFQRHILASGYVRASELNRQSGSVQGYWVQRARRRVKNTLLHEIGDSPVHGLILALVIGDRSAITAQQWRDLRRTGTNHLMAISGLHVGLVAGLAFLLVQRLWRLSARACLRVPAPIAAALAAMLAAWIYAALAGFSIPTQRALLMILITMLALVRKRPLQASRTLAQTLLLVLLLDPLAVLSAGFWLSFSAVALIFYGLSGRLGRASRWRQSVKVQGGISLGLLPLMILLFQQASLLAPLANLFAVPLVGLVVVPLVLLGTLLSLLAFAPGALLLHAAAWLLWQLQGVLGWLAHWPLSTWNSAAPPWWGLLPAIIGAIIVLAPRGWPGKWPAALLLLPLLLLRAAPLPEGQVRFTLLDVGQGLSAVLQTRHHTLVFDTGPRFGPDFDAGQAVLVPFLRQRGIKRVDRLVISHGDGDHIGGMASLLASLPVGEILTSAPKKLAPRVSRICHRGQQWNWDGVRFEFLHPQAEESLRHNDASCVLKISAGGQSVLLPGDIEKPAERDLLRSAGAQLHADILVAPHHGSNTSSTLAFIQAVRPHFVLFPVGYRNRYGFPRPRVVARYRKLGAELVRTDQAGAIEFVLGGDQLIAQQYRRRHHRYWQTPRQDIDKGVAAMVSSRKRKMPSDVSSHFQ